MGTSMNPQSLFSPHSSQKIFGGKNLSVENGSLGSATVVEVAARDVVVVDSAAPSPRAVLHAEMAKTSTIDGRRRQVWVTLNSVCGSSVVSASCKCIPT